jgi:ABC-type branched-subunit amino acid transport system substrate-binding protein
MKITGNCETTRQKRERVPVSKNRRTIKLRSLRSMITVLVAFLLIAPIASSASATVKKGATIGAVWQLTGGDASLGIAFQYGERAGVHYVNAHGGVLGGKLNVITEDDASSPVQAAAVVRKLAGDHVAAIVGDDLTPDNLGMDTVANADKIPLFTAASSPTVYGAGANPYIFGTAGTSDELGTVDVNYLTKTLGLSKIGIIYEDSAYGDGGLAGSEAALKAVGLTPVASESFALGSTSMTAQLSALQSAGATGVLMWTYGANLNSVLQGFTTLGWYPAAIGPPATIDAIGNISSTGLQSIYGGPTPRILLTTVSGGGLSAAGKSFLSAYAWAVGSKASSNTFVPDILDAIDGYDNVLVAAAAINAAHSTSGKAIRNVLLSGKPFKAGSAVITYSKTRHTGYPASAYGFYRANSTCGFNGCVAAPGLFK